MLMHSADVKPRACFQDLSSPDLGEVLARVGRCTVKQSACRETLKHTKVVGVKECLVLLHIHLRIILSLSPLDISRTKQPDVKCQTTRQATPQC